MIEVDGPLGRVSLVESADDLSEVSALLSSRAPVALDTETTGLDMYAPGFAVRMVQFGTVDRGYAIPADLAEGIVNRLDRPVYIHNRTYDTLSIERHYGRGFDTLAPLAVDTGILSRVLDPRAAYEGGSGHSLDELGRYYLSLDDKGEAKDALKRAGRKLKIKAADLWSQVPITTPEYWQYAGQDTILTARVAVELAERVKERGLGKVVSLEHRVAYDLAHLQRRGMLLDVEWAEKAKAEYEADLYAAEGRLMDDWYITPTGEYAHKAIPQLVEAFKKAGVTTWPAFTATGREQLTQAVLDGFQGHAKAEVRELAKVVKQAQEARHFYGYVDDFLARVGVDGRVHPDVKPLAAKTGRMSISNPPLQQLPRDDYRLRGCFVADEGHVLIGCDYSQIEMRIAAAVCGEENLKTAILNGEDVYMRIANILGGPEHRQAAKTGLLGSMYGAGPKKLAVQLGIPQAQADEVYRAKNEAYPELARYSKRLASYIEAHPDWWPVSLTGRPLAMPDPDHSYAGLNRIVQPEAREVMALAVTRLFDGGLGDALRLVVHDEGIFSVPLEHVDTAEMEIGRLMSSEYRGIPLTAEAQVLGPRWKKA